MVKLTTPVVPVIKFIVVSSCDGDVLNQPKVTPVVDHERMMSEVRRAVNEYLYSREVTS
jgi:hypothetical protein